MPIITLTSDWGLSDHYVAAAKGYVMSHCPEANVVDISHNIPPFDLNKASFILKNAYPFFPKGSIHVLGVLSESDLDIPHVLVRYDGHYFIGADNGVFSLIFKKEPEEIIHLDLMQENDYFTFPETEIFLQAACKLVQGAAPEDLGEKKAQLKPRMNFQPVLSGNILKGKVIYIDRYENAIVNISEENFRKARQGRNFSIQFSGGRYKINNISKSYLDVPEGEMLALFGSHGFLEIAINKGNAASLLGLSGDDTVRFEFID